MLYNIIKITGLKVLQFLPDKLAVHLLYLRKFRKVANFRNPKTFNEKINWRKLYQRDPRIVIFADKLAVKDEITKLIGEQYIIPTLWSGDDAEDIPFPDLAPPYVIKTNHGCGDSIFVRSSENVDKQNICKKINAANQKKYGVERCEWAYQHIPHKILVERMLFMPDGNVPDDHKFFVYNGKVHFVQFDTGRSGAHEMAFFDREWTKLPFTKGNPRTEHYIPKPQHYDLMIELAEKIGIQFDFVRVDLYNLPEGVFFGEATFYPAGGLGLFHPSEWDAKVGEPWVIKQ